MGRAKAELEVGGRPILQFLLDRWRWPGPTLLITAPGRESPPGAERFDAEATDSDTPDAAGPLRGVHTALLHARTAELLITTVDMPAIGSSQLHWMAAQLCANPDWLGLMLTRPLGTERQLEPFPFACRSPARPVVEARLASGRRSVVGLGAEPGFVVQHAPAAWPTDTWTNLNTPADYAAFIASSRPPAV